MTEARCPVCRRLAHVNVGLAGEVDLVGLEGALHAARTAEEREAAWRAHVVPRGDVEPPMHPHQLEVLAVFTGHFEAACFQFELDRQFAPESRGRLQRILIAAALAAIEEAARDIAGREADMSYERFASVTGLAREWLAREEGRGPRTS